MELRFRGSKGDQGGKGTVLMRSRCEKQGDGDAVELLVELFRHYGSGEQVADSRPLMAYRNEASWEL